MRVKKAELILQEKLRKGEFSLTEKDSHILAAKKERQYKKMQKALKMDRNYKPGSAFDFETQEKKRLQRLYEKELKKSEKLEKKQMK